MPILIILSTIISIIIILIKLFLGNRNLKFELVSLTVCIITCLVILYFLDFYGLKDGNEDGKEKFIEFTIPQTIGFNLINFITILNVFLVLRGNKKNSFNN